MHIRHTFLFLLFLWTMTGCQCKQTGQALEKALQLSGSNRQELENVLEYFSKNPSDSLKLKAARFLIENMPGHWGPDPESIGDYIKAVDSIQGLPAEIRRVMLNAPAMYPEEFPKMKRVDDIRIIKSEQLIKHINRVFQLKDSCEWLQHIEFGQFCEGILPYRIANEVLDFHYGETPPALLEDFQYATQYYDDCRHCPYSLAMFLQKRRMFTELYPVKDSRLYKFAYGGTQAKMVTSLRLRRLGVPGVVDYEPGENSQRNRMIYSTPISSRLFNRSYHETFRPNSTKFYRMTYAHNPIPQPEGNEYVPPFFRNPFQKDITEEYLHTKDIELELDLPDSFQYAYLTIWQNQEWLPVSYGEVNNGKCRFTKLGTDAVYLPVYYPDGKMKALSQPFILCKTGQIKSLQTNENKNIIIERTAPFHGRFNYRNEEFAKARIECADEPTFKNPQTVYVFGTPPNFRQVISCWQDEYKKRYWRLKLSNTFTYLSEFHFLDAEGNTLQGNSLNGSENVQKSLTDNNSRTFGEVRGWWTVDFGKPETVTGVRYMLLVSDGNIVEGHEYELFYFDTHDWKSFGKQKAEGLHLTFEQIPGGCLYQLKDLTSETWGNIFTEENGRIKFW